MFGTNIFCQERPNYQYSISILSKLSVVCNSITGSSCIYSILATGAFGRYEANVYSGIDLFGVIIPKVDYEILLRNRNAMYRVLEKKVKESNSPPLLVTN